MISYCIPFQISLFQREKFSLIQKPFTTIEHFCCTSTFYCVLFDKGQPELHVLFRRVCTEGVQCFFSLIPQWYICPGLFAFWTEPQYAGHIYYTIIQHLWVDEYRSNGHSKFTTHHFVYTIKSAPTH